MKVTAGRRRDTALPCWQNPPLSFTCAGGSRCGPGSPGLMQGCSKSLHRRMAVKSENFTLLNNRLSPSAPRCPGTARIWAEPAGTSRPRVASPVPPVWGRRAGFIHVIHERQDRGSSWDTRLFQHPDEFLKLFNRNQLYPGEPSSGRRPDHHPRCGPQGAEHPVPVPVSPSPRVQHPGAGSRGESGAGAALTWTTCTPPAARERAAGRALLPRWGRCQLPDHTDLFSLERISA